MRKELKPVHHPIPTVDIYHLLGVYSDPGRDPRMHTLSVVWVGKAEGIPRACDDAKNSGLFNHKNLPGDPAFDHENILNDYFKWKQSGSV